MLIDALIEIICIVSNLSKNHINNPYLYDNLLYLLEKKPLKCEHTMQLIESNIIKFFSFFFLRKKFRKKILTY